MEESTNKIKEIADKYDMSTSTVTESMNKFQLDLRVMLSEYNGVVLTEEVRNEIFQRMSYILDSFKVGDYRLKEDKKKEIIKKLSKKHLSVNVIFFKILILDI